MTLSLDEMKANRRKWVEALRGGKYAQCTDKLYNGEGGYCCLGVLASVAGETAKDIKNDTDLGALPNVMEFVGLRDSEGAYEDGCLVVHNDKLRKTFAEIADIIESEPAGLFTDPA